MSTIEVKYEVDVRRIVTTTEEGKPQETKETVLADSTAGGEETAGLLRALADRVAGDKKGLIISQVLKVATAALKAETEKMKAGEKSATTDLLAGLLAKSQKPAAPRR